MRWFFRYDIWHLLSRLEWMKKAAVMGCRPVGVAERRPVRWKPATHGPDNRSCAGPRSLRHSCGRGARADLTELPAVGRPGGDSNPRPPGCASGRSPDNHFASARRQCLSFARSCRSSVEGVTLLLATRTDALRPGYDWVMTSRSWDAVGHADSNR